MANTQVDKVANMEGGWIGLQVTPFARVSICQFKFKHEAKITKILPQ